MGIGRLTLALVVSLALSVPAHAQLPAAGQRVRITLEKQPRSVEGHTAAQVLRGELTGIDADGMMVRLHPGVGPASVAFSAVRTLEVSRGVETWYDGAWRRGRDTALLIGLEFFVIEWLAEEGQFRNPLEAGFIGAGIGMTVGAIVGAILPQEVWRQVTLPR